MPIYTSHLDRYQNMFLETTAIGPLLRARRRIIGAALLICLLCAVLVAVGGSDAADAQSTATDVRIVARRLSAGEVEFGLQQRRADASWGERLVPSNRFFPADADVGKWLASSTIGLAAAHVRIVARRLSAGEVEFGLQQRRADASWGERLVPSKRFFPADADVGKWMSSSPLRLQPSATVAAPAWDPVSVLISKEGVDGVVRVYDVPNGRRLSFPDGELWSRTFRGNRLVVRVTQGVEGDEWVQAELPVRPSGVRGWIRSENFNWVTHNHHILVDISARSVALYDGNKLVISTRAIVGKTASPTPTLRGFIVEKLPNHRRQNGGGTYGDWILMLSFFSEAYNSFGGGLPRIALHGTNIPQRVGEALSNGCIRIPNKIIETIARGAPLGTVVNVVA